MGRIQDKYRNWARNTKGIQGYSSEFDISARIGKHYCPYCNNLLQIRRKKQIVNSESEEAKNFNHYAYGGNIGGNTEFNWDVFYCAKCDLELSTDDITLYERKKKKAYGNLDFDTFRRDKYRSDKKVNKRLNFIVTSLIVLAIFILFILSVNHGF